MVDRAPPRPPAPPRPGELLHDDALRAEVAARLAAFPSRRLDRSDSPAGATRRAAVAIALLPDDAGRACFVLTVRGDLNRHAGQFALPGGRLDPGEDAVAAALREMEEEVGLAVPREAVVGRLDDYPTRSGFVISPVVVWIDRPVVLTPDPGEVAAVFRVPLSHLDRPDLPELGRIAESDRPVLSFPLLSTEIYAPTAAILYQLREVALYGRATRVAEYEEPVWAWR